MPTATHKNSIETSTSDPHGFAEQDHLVESIEQEVMDPMLQEGGQVDSEDAPPEDGEQPVQKQLGRALRQVMNPSRSEPLLDIVSTYSRTKDEPNPQADAALVGWTRKAKSAELEDLLSSENPLGDLWFKTLRRQAGMGTVRSTDKLLKKSLAKKKRTGEAEPDEDWTKIHDREFGHTWWFDGEFYYYWADGTTRMPHGWRRMSDGWDYTTKDGILYARSADDGSVQKLGKDGTWRSGEDSEGPDGGNIMEFPTLSEFQATTNAGTLKRRSKGLKAIDDLIVAYWSHSDEMDIAAIDGRVMALQKALALARRLSTDPSTSRRVQASLIAQLPVWQDSLIQLGSRRTAIAEFGLSGNGEGVKPPAPTDRFQSFPTRARFEEQTNITGVRRGSDLKGIDENIDQFNQIDGFLDSGRKVVALAMLSNRLHRYLVGMDKDLTHGGKKRKALVEGLQHYIQQTELPRWRARREELQRNQNDVEDMTGESIDTVLTSPDLNRLQATFQAPPGQWRRSLARIFSQTMPVPGGDTTLELQVNVPLPGPAGTGLLGGLLKLAMERQDDGQLTTCRADLHLTGGWSAAFVTIKGALGGYVEAAGKTSADLADLFMYGLYNRMLQSKIVPHQLVDTLFGGTSATFEEAEDWRVALENRLFAGEDGEGVYAETGGVVGGEASGSVGIAAMKGTFENSNGTQYSAESLGEKLGQRRDSRDERINGEKHNNFSLGFEAEMGPYTAAAAFAFDTQGDPRSKEGAAWEAGIEGSVVVKHALTGAGGLAMQLCKGLVTGGATALQTAGKAKKKDAALQAMIGESTGIIHGAHQAFSGDALSNEMWTALSKDIEAVSSAETGASLEGKAGLKFVGRVGFAKGDKIPAWEVLIQSTETSEFVTDSSANVFKYSLEKNKKLISITGKGKKYNVTSMVRESLTGQSREGKKYGDEKFNDMF